MTSRNMKEDVFNCNACGACYGRGPQNPFRADDIAPIGFCPMINHFKFETFSARGISFLARAVIHEGFPLTEGLTKVFYTCTDCGACEEVCKALPTLSITRAIRAEISKKSLEPIGVKNTVNHIVKTFNRFGRNNADRDWLANELKLPRKGKDVYFASCYASLHPSFAESARAQMEILRGAGMEVAYLGKDQWCCGLIPYWNGNADVVQDLAKHNVEVMKASGAKRVIFDCPECYSTWANAYKEILNDVPFELVHISEVYSDLVDKGSLKFNKRLKRKVTYHDPCHLGRHAHVFEAPRKVIKSIPGIELKEMEKSGRWSYCCGGGSGIVLYSYPDYSRAISEERLRQAMNVAEEVVTTCPWCIDQLRNAAQREKANVKVTDLSMLIKEATFGT